METKKKRSASKTPPANLSMTGLARASGVSLKTVRTYIDAGLLPPPEKKRGTIAYYDARCINMINMIDRFHSKYSLPLTIIRQVIDEIGHEKALQERGELTKKLNQAKKMPWFEHIADASNKPLFTKKALILATGLSPKDLDKAIAQKLIMPDKNGLFCNNDMDLALLLSQLKGTGAGKEKILLDFLKMQLQMTEYLVEKEFNAFFKNVINKNISVEDANELAEKAIDVLTTLLPLCYRQLLNRKIEELRKT
ncbi:MAG: MerR family transcriptional regulator [Thermodesulfobacteriota bacterium]|nr:MerR family transcriptional regulator [Thermodesulfobacteriota bacterium]